MKSRTACAAVLRVDFSAAVVVGGGVEAFGWRVFVVGVGSWAFVCDDRLAMVFA